ncbi:MAG: zinc finger domain-containing protein, partial [Acidimicrobiia bacterium]
EQHPAWPRCHAELRKTRHGGRSTLWCPACQPSPA